MAERVTQLPVEVLTTGSPKLRATQLPVEVLYRVAVGAIPDTLGGLGEGIRPGMAF